VNSHVSTIPYPGSSPESFAQFAYPATAPSIARESRTGPVSRTVPEFARKIWTNALDPLTGAGEQHAELVQQPEAEWTTMHAGHVAGL